MPGSLVLEGYQLFLPLTCSEFSAPYNIRLHMFDFCGSLLDLVVVTDCPTQFSFLPQGKEGVTSAELNKPNLSQPPGMYGFFHFSWHTLQRAEVTCTGHSGCKVELRWSHLCLPCLTRVSQHLLAQDLSGCASYSAVPASGCRPCMSGKIPKLLERSKSPTSEGTGAVVRAEVGRPNTAGSACSPP